MDRQELLETLRYLAATELARLWVKVTGLISDVTLSPALEEMVADYEMASEADQRFFVLHTERCLQKAHQKLQRGV